MPWPDSPQADDLKFAVWKEENGDVTVRGRRRKKTEEGDRYQILKKKMERGKQTFLACPSESSFRSTLTVESLPTAKLLLLVNYRPEYQHGWGSKTYYTQLRLDPLPPESADAFLRVLLGDDPSLEPLKKLLIEGRVPGRCGKFRWTCPEPVTSCKPAGLRLSNQGSRA